MKLLNKHLLKISLPAHCLLVISFFLVEYSWVHYIGILIGWTLIGGYGVAVGYHRLFAHKSFDTYPAVRKTLAYLGLLSGDGSLPFWVSLHRGFHHRFSDTAHDPHTPIKGIWHSFFGWQLGITHGNINLMYSRDLFKDRFIMFLHNHQYKVYWGTFLILLSIDVNLALGIFIPASILSHHQDNLVNVLGHTKGFLRYRNFDTKDKSVNDVITGLLVWGQGWHNNHHNNPSLYNYGGIKWWEYDVAAKILIPLIKRKSISD